jgi:hypothetical protein
MSDTNCRNCGAPLKNSKCEYCGSEYGFFYQDVKVENKNVVIHNDDTWRPSYQRRVAEYERIGKEINHE